MALNSISVLDSNKSQKTVYTVTPGRDAAADSIPVALANEDKTAIDNVKSSVDTINNTLESGLTIEDGSVIVEGAVSKDIGFVHYDDERYEIKSAGFSVSASGSNVIVAGVSGKYIAVLEIMLIASDDVEVSLKDTDGNILIGNVTVPKQGGFARNSSYFVGKTIISEGVSLELSDAIQVGGNIVWIEFGV